MSDPLPDRVRQFHSLYNFYTNTIRSTVGLRGFTLQLRVEKAASVDELLALRVPYLELVRRARGSERADALARQLDTLLDGAPPA